MDLEKRDVRKKFAEKRRKCASIVEMNLRDCQEAKTIFYLRKIVLTYDGRMGIHNEIVIVPT
ncbi:hypothetical protein NCCP2222_38560 [Sporosarcina sp. NCCP-2222]|nr:hypothetical protein NCCP2222_38560 [Sporosarcina sp. NCCP-2222]